ncbi:hypothetical protein ACA910_003181 [Epithemia clementina (nom. ined.)]
MFTEPHRFINVQPFAEEYAPLKDIPITTTATVWTDSNNNSYLLLFHQALFFGEKCLAQSLICPNQLRANGLIVNDVPRQFDPQSNHSIDVPDADLTIPLSLQGIISGFHTEKPTPRDLEDLPRIVMTADAPWHPASDSFANAEEKFKVATATATVCNGDQNSIAASSVPCMLAAFQTYDTAFHAGNPELDADANGDELYNWMIAAVRVSGKKCINLHRWERI